MNEILSMREKRAKLWDATKAFVESRKDANGTLSAEDTATYEKMEADVVRMGKEIERLERQEALDLEFDRPTSRPLVDKPLSPEDKPRKIGSASDEYKSAFWHAMRDKSVPHEVYNVLKIGEDDHGGYLVPDEYERQLIDALQEQNIFRQLAHVISTSSGDRKIPVVRSHGTAAWIDENAAYPESDDTFGQISISAFKLATTIKVSDELLHDSVFDVPSYMTPKILHIDMNKFYASVEQMLNPQLKNKAIAVCGSTEERHGIVLTASAEAKARGVKTGMANWEARRACPGLIVVPPQYDQYCKYSKLARAIYGRYSDRIEPFGMDECWVRP